MADVIAHEMKEWAIEKGATHYSHWFQPLTGATAEKHDAFLSAPKASRMPPPSRPAVFVPPLRPEAIRHGTVPLRRL